MNKQVKENRAIKNGEMTLTLTEAGDIQSIRYGSIMINQLIHHPLDGSMTNIYLRIFDGETPSYHPLIGLRSASDLFISTNQIRWTGSIDRVGYAIEWTLYETGWDVTARLQADVEMEADLVYAQDIAIADVGAVRTNEAYVSQYIDHHVESSDRGFSVLSRQNQRQSTGFPALSLSSKTKTIGYVTDGFDLYGLSYKQDGKISGLRAPRLASRVYQYEFAMTALQTEAFTLGTTPHETTFSVRFLPHHPEALDASSVEKFESLKTEAMEDEAERVERLYHSPIFGRELAGRAISEAEVAARYPDRLFEERVGGKLLSFFCGTTHIVLSEKENVTERSHGTILMNGGPLKPDQEKFATTVYMPGVFNSHIVLGNTSFNKGISNIRNPLNIAKTSGQRIYIEDGESYRLLTMPSLFEMTPQQATWHYLLDDDEITVTNLIAGEKNAGRLTVVSKKKRAYRFLISTQVTMGNNEYDTPFRIEKMEREVVLSTEIGASSEKAPGLRYSLMSDCEFDLLTTRELLETAIQDESIAWIRTEPKEVLHLDYAGSIEGEPFEFIADPAEEAACYAEWHKRYLNGFEADLSGRMGALYLQAYWYTHNMRIHYQSPHGLEQYGGAAWGTRDVSQGPMEFLLSTGHFEEAHELLKMIFAHQFMTGDWPQWFMFDRYAGIQQEDSHGDVIIWPLKALTDYIRLTDSFDILDEKVTFRDHEGQELGASETILVHVERALENIESNFIAGTHLSAYGGGDWDDTLQPANETLKKNLISSWTVALTYQAVSQLHHVLRTAAPQHRLTGTLESLSKTIRVEFNEQLIIDGVIPGFLHKGEAGMEAMIHPSDETLPMKYRLLPMTRSVIAELVEPEQAARNLEIVQEKLLFPDGVHLMDRPALYRGGVSSRFMRAEQAANFGREIGLQYVHAHIRYIEALAKVGKGREAWDALKMINPITMQEDVPNALPRQRNAYFSSSDGAFLNRYEAEARFSELKDGHVPVKGGWRIYSSGPGIWFNQLFANVLGLRAGSDRLTIDPVIDPGAGPLRFQTNLFGRLTHVTIEQGMETYIELNGRRLTGERVANPYRTGGVTILRKDFEKAARGENELKISL